MRPTARFLAVAMLCICITGCATVQQTQPLNTPSGRPEITVPADRVDSVIAYVLSVSIDRGYTIRQQTPAMIMMERPANNLQASMLFGSQFNANPNLRAIWNIIRSEDTTRIIGDLSIVTNPGSGYERANPITGGPAIQQMQEMQEILTTAAALR